MSTTTAQVTAKDFASDQEVKWCPGCGDYSILKQLQSIMPETGVARENTVFISGIGCSSRLPYYMNTYGFHSIHGRAPALATGVKCTNPELDVWVITGDGDALSIGGNHLIHVLRRNVNLNVVLFNNEIYGLTKGQYSPTSHLGQKTKSSPLGVIDTPFLPLSLALGARGSFIARSADRNPKHLRDILLLAQQHKGTSFVEVLQNCNIFNDGAFELFTDKDSKDNHTLYLEEGKPLVFGDNQSKGIKWNDGKPKVVSLDEFSLDELWIHDSSDKFKAMVLSDYFDAHLDTLPKPFGVFYQEDRPTYDDLMNEQVEEDKKKNTESLQDAIRGDYFWTVE